MSMTVWKFQLEARALQDIEMSAGAKIIKVGLQRGHICLWAWCVDYSMLIRLTHTPTRY